MRNLLVILTVALALTTSGCNSVWWQNFKNDPVTQVNTAVSWANGALSVATVTFNSIVGSLPPETAAKARKDFDLAVLTAHHAIAALQDAVEAAAEAGKEKPDFAAAITALISAVDEVKQVIDAYHTQASKLAVSRSTVVTELPVGYDELVGHMAGLKRAVRR